MKNVLEEIQIAEGQTKLTDEQIKLILAKNGELINNEVDKVTKTKEEEINNYKSTVNELKDQLENAPKSDELETYKTKIAELEAKEQKRIQEIEIQKQEEVLNTGIMNSKFGTSKFINEFTKNAILNEMKTQIKNEENNGKSYNEIFEQITKDKENIFVNENNIPDMTGMEDISSSEAKKEIPLVF